MMNMHINGVYADLMIILVDQYGAVYNRWMWSIE